MKILVFAAVLLTTVSASAVPGGLYLASPKHISIDGPKNSVKLYFDLNCKNEFPDEWAGNLVAVSDDEGDMAIALGVVLAESACDKGPKKQYIFTYPLSAAGVTLDDIKRDVTLVPIDLKN